MEALRKGREKLSGILDAVTDCMIMIDEEFNVIWANNLSRCLFEKDPIGGKNVVGLSVINTDPVCIKFGRAIGAAWIERCLFILRKLLGLSIKLACGGLIKTDTICHVQNPNGLKQP